MDVPAHKFASEIIKCKCDLCRSKFYKLMYPILSQVAVGNRSSQCRFSGQGEHLPIVNLHRSDWCKFLFRSLTVMPFACLTDLAGFISRNDQAVWSGDGDQSVPFSCSSMIILNSSCLSPAAISLNIS
jgi:hypothetical protein